MVREIQTKQEYIDSLQPRLEKILEVSTVIVLNKQGFLTIHLRGNLLLNAPCKRIIWNKHNVILLIEIRFYAPNHEILIQGFFFFFFKSSLGVIRLILKTSCGDKLTLICSTVEETLGYLNLAHSED